MGHSVNLHTLFGVGIFQVPRVRLSEEDKVPACHGLMVWSRVGKAGGQRPVYAFHLPFIMSVNVVVMHVWENIQYGDVILRKEL
jgi:hypothetical protein